MQLFWAVNIDRYHECVGKSKVCSNYSNDWCIQLCGTARNQWLDNKVLTATLNNGPPFICITVVSYSRKIRIALQLLFVAAHTTYLNCSLHCTCVIIKLYDLFISNLNINTFFPFFQVSWVFLSCSRLRK